MATKKTTTKPKMKEGGSSKNDCKKQTCNRESYWRQDLCRCVKLLSMDGLMHPPSENDIMIKKGIKSLKDGFNKMSKEWFGVKQKGGSAKPTKKGNSKPTTSKKTVVRSKKK